MDTCWTWHYIWDRPLYIKALKELRHEDRPLFKRIITDWKQAKKERLCKTCLYYYLNSEFPTEGYNCYLDS